MQLGEEQELLEVVPQHLPIEEEEPSEPVHNPEPVEEPVHKPESVPEPVER